MKTKPAYIEIKDEDGNIIDRIPMTEADDDWIRAGRLPKKAREGDKKAAEKFKKMQNTQMVEYVDEDENDELKIEKIKIVKSTRHSKITGDFAESLLLYWLSKYGFECSNVDHTGIDILARNLHTKELMGISVKSRSRKEGTEKDYLLITNGNFEKIDAACATFGCTPYLAIVVDAADVIKVFILRKEHFLEIAPMRKRAAGWKMNEEWLQKYNEDDQIMKFEFRTETLRWWGKK